MPHYKFISSKVCVARIMNDVSTDQTDWIARSPEWINQCLGQIGIYANLENAREEVTVEEYKAELPCDIKLLRAIEYEKYRLPAIGRYINSKFPEDIENQTHPVHSYELNLDGYIVTTFEEGDIIIHYKRLPLDYDVEMGIYFPKIPDVEKIIDTICDYIKMKMLQRNIPIPGMSLRENNEFTNPGISYKNKIKGARNSVNAMDADAREQLSRLIRTFLINYNAYHEDFFIKKNTDG